MELTVSLHYLPKVTVEGQRVPSSRFVTTDDVKEKTESKFWEENRNKFRSNIVNNLDIWEWVEMFEQVIDENVIATSTLECIAFNTHFNNDTYEVNFDITFKFDVIDEEQFFIQSNRMKTLLCNYLNEHRGFIDTGDNGTWLTDNEMCVHYDVEVYMDDLNVGFEIRK